MTPEDRKVRAQQAERLMNESLVGEALESLDEEYIQIWRNAETTEAREDAHRYITLVAKFKEHMKTIMSDGVFADSDIKEMEGRNRKWFG